MKLCLKVILIVTAVFNLFTSILAGDTNKIYALISSDVNQYKLAYSGFKDTVEKETKASITSGTIKEQNREELLSHIQSYNPGILLAIGTKAFKFAKEIQGDRKIIYCMVFLEKEGDEKNISGIKFNIPEEYKIKKIKEIMPDSGTAGVIYTGSSENQFENLKKACEENNINVVSVKTESGDKFLKALNRIKNKADFFVMLTDSVLYYPASVQYLFQESVDNGFPVIGLSSFYTKAGAVLSFDFNYYNVGVDAAQLVLSKYFKDGAYKKTNLSDRIVYSLNVRVAKELGIVFSKESIDNASEVFGK